MTFISYAQNFEDVMLWRALSHIQQGFYIDAGAWSPDEDSVTRAFYERGWRGINIEPNPVWLEQLLEKRPEDINLQLALSDKIDTLKLYVAVDVTGLSTTDAEFAKKNKESGQSIQELFCQATTLNKLWENYVNQKQVHFLKIDVEGAEESVLRGNDWTKNRPWIILLESVYPNSQIPIHHTWEKLLLDAKYDYVYSDGINRFYIAKEHSNLATAFLYPPNVFDQFKLSSHAQADAQVQILSQQNQELFQRYQDLSQQYQFLEVKHALSLRILSSLKQTKTYRFFRKLRQWEWLEKGIQSLVDFHPKQSTL